MSLPLVLLLEATLLVPLPHTPTMTHDAIVHAVTGLTDQTLGTPVVTADGLAVPEAIVPPALRPRLALVAAEPTPSAALTKLRALLPELQKETRTLRHPTKPAPLTVAALKEGFGFEAWPKREIAESAVKGLARRLFRGPGASVALTLAPDGAVRETELILAREDGSGQFDFYAYDDAGNLATTSTFRTGGGTDVAAAVPYSCMTCHYDADGRRFVRPPVWSP